MNVKTISNYDNSKLSKTRGTRSRDVSFSKNKPERLSFDDYFILKEISKVEKIEPQKPENL